MIRHKTAKRICSDWHGGQWSALYQFASSGEYTIANHLRYLQEIERGLHPEYELYPCTLSKKHDKELNGLKQFFIKAGEMSGIKTVYYAHELYGYLIPTVSKDIDPGIKKKITAIRYLP